jgi:hypothetical protein
MVMSAAPTSKILGPYRRTYEKNIIQQITIDRSPENILLLAINLAYAPGGPARFCRGLAPKKLGI